MRFLLHWKHRNIILFFLSIGVAYLLSTNPLFKNITTHVGALGYLEAIIAGALFASTFTVAIGGLILVTLAKTIPPFGLIACAALGAILVDSLVFTLVRHTVADEITPLYQELNHHSHLRRLIHTKYFGWTLAVIGALIIASPLPDELGVSLLGVSKMQVGELIAISAVSHVFGIFLVVSAGLLG